MATEDDDEVGNHGIEDMIQLLDLTEANILKNLVVRYGKEKIYTYTGSILVAVNPYKMFNIYGIDMVKKYQHQVLGDQPPHLFAIGSAAYNQMTGNNENQVIVISGESGAGKTESTKLFMQYLAAVNKSEQNLITEQILEATPLLESFGNAKTIRNDNSSRFGKYVEVYFKGGSIVGSKTSEYLLEKSRLVTQAANERNYHIFYEMLVGLTTEQKEKYGLESAPKYFYLNQGGSCEIPSRDDLKDFKELVAAMDVLGFTSQEQETIFKILASVLHLGNVYFKKKQNEHSSDTVELGNDGSIQWVSHLLDLSPGWLQQGITMKVTEARQERLLTPLTIDQALDARDAIAKALYSRLFTWLVEKVNHIVYQLDKEKSLLSIAILDIFGFEDFKMNSFEQLCINFANESLQMFFNRHIFKLEQQEYNKERIDWTQIDYYDNQPTIDLIAKKPHGILHVLDDESNFPKGTDSSFLDKCHFNHTGSELYGKPRMSSPLFAIQHYAGTVAYTVKNFLDKNRDTLRNDVVQLMIQSKNKMISSMFQEWQDQVLTKTQNKINGRFSSVSKSKAPTVASGFNESLVALMEKMNKCNPWFVRCIKPNNDKAPMIFQKEVVLSQLRYSGMLETIRIRKLGYPVRHHFQAFADKFHSLLKERTHPNGKRWEDKEVCKKVLEGQGARWLTFYQLGLSMVFMKEKLSYHLGGEREKVVSGAVLILQTQIRAILARKEYLKLQRGAVIVQKYIRRWIQRLKYRKIRDGFIKAQAQIRMIRARRKYFQMRDEERRKKEEEEKRIEMEKKRQQVTLERQKLIQQQRAHNTKERQARSVAGVAHLEIPAELAFIFNQLDDWQPLHSDRQLNTVVGHVQSHDQHLSLPPNINDFSFNKYTNVYFKDHKWKMLKKPTNKPFLPKQSDADTKESLALFKLILRFMNDATLTGKRERYLADYIVHRGIKREGLRDEIYVQLCNQTWLNKTDANLERGWLLMSNCLSAFPPSNTLYYYLLKYVSDHAYNGFKAVCQHKLLSCMGIEGPLCRFYPPTSLEWKASRKKAAMALEAKLPDGETSVAPVHSWTTGEEFAKHILNNRKVTEGSHGWTPVLYDDNDIYELGGYDFVLDLIGEMEVALGFKIDPAQLLVYTDHLKPGNQSRKQYYKGMPHDPEDLRTLNMDIQELSDPVPLSPRPAPQPENFFKPYTPAQSDSPYGTREGLGLSPSVLNKRKGVGEETGLAASKLNVRYVHKKQPAPSPPGLTPNGDVTEPTALSTSKLNKRYNNTPDDLAKSKLNNRYNTPHTPGQTNGQIVNIPNGHMPNGGLPNGDVPLSESKLNKRYAKFPHKHTHTSPEGVAGRPQNTAEMDQWLDDVFKLEDHSVDQLGDPRLVEKALKGGGRGVTGIPTQPTSQAMNLGLGGTYTSGGITLQPAQQTISAPAAGSFSLGNIGMSLPPQPMPPAPVINVDPIQAAQQAYASSMQQQQQLQIQQQLQQQMLQNQLLQQTIQGEQLKKQLDHLQNDESKSQSSQEQPKKTPPPLVSPKPSVKTPESPTKAAGEIDRIKTAEPPTKAAGEIDTRRPGGVKTLRGNFENKIPPLSPNLFKPLQQTERPQEPVVPLKEVTFEDSNAKLPHLPQVPLTKQEDYVGDFPPPSPTSPPQPILEPETIPDPPPPPPPEMFSSSGAEPARMLDQPAVPPTPPNVVRASSQKGKGPGPGKIRMQWPPPSESNKKKADVEVGRILIDEKKSLRQKKEPLKSKQDLHQRTMELIRARSNDPSLEQPVSAKDLPLPPVPKEEKVTIDMQERRKLLEKRLSQAGILKDDTDKSPAPPPPPPVPETPEPPPPVPERQVEPVVQKVIEKEPEVIPPLVIDESDEEEDDHVDYRRLEMMVTKLLPEIDHPYYSYNRVPWTLEIRKEVFTPLEKVESPVLVHLLFCQIVQDVYAGASVRINKDDKLKMKNFLENHRIEPRTVLDSHPAPIKKQVIDIAREWPYYFSRLFAVMGGSRHPDAALIGVNQTGVRLLSRDKDIYHDQLTVLQHHRFDDIINVSVPKPGALQIHSHRDQYIIVYTPRAVQIKNMIEAFLIECDKDVVYVRAIRPYLTREATLLSFDQGEIIKLTNKDMALDRGWLYGTVNGRLGMFPADHIESLPTHAVEKQSPSNKPELRPHSTAAPLPRQPIDVEPKPRTPPPIEPERPPTPLNDGKYSMLEFAMMNYRESPYRYQMVRSDVTGSISGKFNIISSLKARQMKKSKKGKNKDSWTWKEQADMVKWSQSPIQASLLKFDAPLNKAALECFISIMRYMGDYPLGRGQKLVDCVFSVLMACHKNIELKDEVYCQLVKQVTNNRSVKQDSLVQGWRFLSIVTAYFDCSAQLEKYLFKYIEQIAYDNQRANQDIALNCLQNLRKTFKHGGRKNVPSFNEIDSITKGRLHKRQQCILAGGNPVVLNVKNSSVVQDAIDQVCENLGINGELEREEYTCFYVVPQENNFSPLTREEYIFDVTTELTNQKQDFYLLIQRCSWVFPVQQVGNDKYIDVMYSQSLPDFFDGFLLVNKPDAVPPDLKKELAALGALQLRAMDKQGPVQQKDIETVIPRPLLQMPNTNVPEWTNMVHEQMRSVQSYSPIQAKSQFLGIISKWPRFGSTFFMLKHVQDTQIQSGCMLAVNKEGIYFLHSDTHETIMSYPFSQVISTRRFRTEDNISYLELKHGDLMQQNIIRIETEQGAEISSLIGEYIRIQNKLRR